MRIKTSTFISTILLASLFATQASADCKGKVVGVTDGDTIKVMCSSTTIKVRLYAIDSPEKSQAFGMQAKKFTSELAFGKVVELIEKDKDPYGRTVAVIKLPDGKILNEEIVRGGYAWHFKRYSSDKAYDDLEQDAREKKLGLWSSPKAQAPWDFRKEQKQKRSTKKTSKTQ